MELRIIADICIVFAVAVPVVMLCNRWRLSPLVGFLLAGVLVGPHGLKLVSGAHEVEILAEVGVALLLFTIGVEISLKELLEARRALVLGGLLQLASTIFVVYLTGVYLLSLSGPQAALLGFVVGLSSTAIVLKLLQERGQLASPQGRAALAVLIFQDLAVVPLLLLVPVLAMGRAAGLGAGLLQTLKGLAIVSAVFVGGRWLMPRLLYRVAREKSRELFLLSVVVLCAAISWLTASLGLSLAIGAFLAGLLLSESDYGTQALSLVVPFRDVFASLFFVSMGMLLDLGFLRENLLLVAGLTLAVVVLKASLAALSVLILGYPLRVAVLSGFSLAQVGEFSFILLESGMHTGLIDALVFQWVLAVIVLSMALTPLVMQASQPLSSWLGRLRLSPRLKGDAAIAGAEGMSNHLVVVGFGLIGRSVAGAASIAGLDYVVIEMNPDTVRRENAAGRHRLIYGDAVYPAVLEQAGVSRAAVVAVTTPDPVAVSAMAAAVRQLNARTHLIVRARYFSQEEPLLRAGSDEVIAEERESAVEIFKRVARRRGVPEAKIRRCVKEIVAGRCEAFQRSGQASEQGRGSRA